MELELILKIAVAVLGLIAGSSEVSRRVPDKKLGRMAKPINFLARNTGHAQNR